MKNISLVPASYKGLTFSELSLPHAHFRAMQWERYEQRLYRSPSLICNNSISPVSNNVSWQRKHSLLWKSDRHTGTMHVNSHRRYPAPVSQEKGKCNRNWMQVFGGRITKPDLLSLLTFVLLPKWQKWSRESTRCLIQT